ncbi:MAG: VCBS domain-containing protein, partial [Rhizobacter sp.]|nr:VCBS domain-containing protein [Rhizobacter sp.]
MAINSTSFTNTPQAGEDFYNLTEDQLYAMGLVKPNNILSLDVMANDLGGKAKTLFSVDDGSGGSLNPTDLLQADGLVDGVSCWERTANGNMVRINNGKVEVDVSHRLGQIGASSIDALGANDTIVDTFVYAIRLGNGTLSWATVRINITGSNDTATITDVGTQDTNVIEAGGIGTPGDAYAGGTLKVNDVDHGENVFQAPSSLVGTYGSFSFNEATGMWSYMLDNNKPATQALSQGVEKFETLIVRSADGTASYTIQVKVTGTNDAAVIGGTSTAQLTETNAAQSTGGTLTVTDVDSPETFQAQTDVTGSNGYGKFTIGTDGVWTYAMNGAHNEFLGGVTYTDSITVKSADGAEKVITVSMLGTNDAAAVSSAVVALDETDLALSTGGTLTSSDVDNDDNTFTPSTTVGTIGTFAIDADGVWTFTANGAYDSLNVGDSVSETYNVASVDGTPSTVKITINGTNDAATVSSAVVALDETDLALSTGGTLTSSDVDNDDNTFTPSTTVGT